MEWVVEWKVKRSNEENSGSGGGKGRLSEEGNRIAGRR